jgi:hypothetical protein
MHKWIDVRERLPEQGKKVLCCDHGDYYVAQRLRECWFQIPFIDSKYSTISPPEYWQEIEFYGVNKGYMVVKSGDKLLKFDELEIENKTMYNFFIESILNDFMHYKKKRDLK